MLDKLDRLEKGLAAEQGALGSRILRKLGLVEKGRRTGEKAFERLGKHRVQVEQYEQFCRTLGEKPADVALAWVLANPAITAPIIGPRTLDQLVTSMRALEVKLDEASMKRLDEIWPGPGGPAPEAYSW